MSVTATRAKIRLPSPETIAERQRLEDECFHLANAASVQYKRETDEIDLRMRSGITLRIPRRLIKELTNASETRFQHELVLGIGGDAISVPSLDVDIAVSGLLRDLLGLNIQRLGGQARSQAKAAASRANGSKGGRPHKKHKAA